MCVTGSFDVIVTDGEKERRFRLDRPSTGLYIPPLIWDTEVNFSPGAVCMVLASDFYHEADYYRDYEAYVAEVGRCGLPSLRL